MTNDILVSDEIPALTTIYHNTGKESNQRNLENFLIIWLNPNIHSIEDDKLTSLKNQLRRTVNYLRIFDQLKPCVEYINEIVDEKIFLILSASLCQEVLPIVADLEQIISIYILFESSINKISIKSKYQHKIAGKYGDINSICEHLKQNVSSLSYNFFTINVLSLIKPLVYVDNDRRMETWFTVAQFHIERLLSTGVWKQSNKKNLIDECRLQYAGNDDQLKLVEEFEKDYHSSKAIWWLNIPNQSSKKNSGWRMERSFVPM
ncbi:unnamed protein product [Adineta steineri]|uniref:Uncharacterized protein n=1 Tax=Adineta steineri TaxID=433720 RepID=A0A815RK28_9BILA|nr:unnamed protein product [Adineta steineri]CAF1478522.1 unnamed protein product [Adineta steineri]